jgi:hypothetical protein
VSIMCVTRNSPPSSRMHVIVSWSQQLAESNMGISALRISQSVLGIASFREEREAEN